VDLMPVRTAKFEDTPAILHLIHEMYARSPYVGRDEVDSRLARSLIMQSIQRHGGTSDGSCWVQVATGENDRVVGFIIGMLDRVYHVGTKLMATDLYYYAGNGTGPRDALTLMDNMLEWATTNPKVIEIKLGAVDTIGDYKRTERLFQRRGLTQCGVIYSKEVRHEFGG
jgi:hypothetical protein